MGYDRSQLSCQTDLQANAPQVGPQVAPKGGLKGPPLRGPMKEFISGFFCIFWGQVRFLTKYNMFCSKIMFFSHVNSMEFEGNPEMHLSAAFPIHLTCFVVVDMCFQNVTSCLMFCFVNVLGCFEKF